MYYLLSLLVVLATLGFPFLVLAIARRLRYRRLRRLTAEWPLSRCIAAYRDGSISRWEMERIDRDRAGDDKQNHLTQL